MALVLEASPRADASEMDAMHSLVAISKIPIAKMYCW